MILHQRKLLFLKNIWRNYSEIVKRPKDSYVERVFDLKNDLSIRDSMIKRWSKKIIRRIRWSYWKYSL